MITISVGSPNEYGWTDNRFGYSVRPSIRYSAILGRPTRSSQVCRNRVL